MRYVIGDVHGCLDTLIALIEKINPDKKDTVIFVGDIIDRGPKSKQTVDYIREKQNSGLDWIVLKGNHEDMLCQCCVENDVDYSDETLTMWIKNGGADTLKTFVQDDGNYYVPEDYVEWFQELPEYHMDSDIIVVHAGLDFQCEDSVYKLLTDIRDNKGTHLWVRDYKVKPNNIYGKKLITGHTITTLDEILNPSKHHVKVDNGCFTGDLYGDDCGHLVAYCVEMEEFTVVKNIDILKKG